jgi:hypothetical protein
MDFDGFVAKGPKAEEGSADISPIVSSILLLDIELNELRSICRKGQKLRSAPVDIFSTISSEQVSNSGSCSSVFGTVDMLSRGSHE